MKIIINTFSQQYSAEISIELIPLGIEGIEVSSSGEVYTLLKENLCSPLLVTENYEASFLRQVKETCPGIYIFLIISPSVKPADLKNLTNTGIHSIIYYNENISLVIDEILKNIETLNIRNNERRAHIRVTPREFDKISSAIFIKSLRKFVVGSILDISAGGIAVKISDSLDASLLIPKSLYDPLFISIQGARIRTLSSLIAIRGDSAGFKFDNIEPEGMKIISSYIHNRISEDIKSLMKNVTFA